MEHFALYGHALVSMALWAVLMMVLSLLSTRGRTAENRCECGKPRRDYADPVYRRDRAYMNAVETTGPFLAATVAAMMAGAAPFWVNLFASVFFLSRVGMAIVHIRTENQPLRSACYMVGWLCMIALVVLAVYAAF